jgi:hypothetical protein
MPSDRLLIFSALQNASSRAISSSESRSDTIVALPFVLSRIGLMLILGGLGGALGRPRFGLSVSIVAREFGPA